MAAAGPLRVPQLSGIWLVLTAELPLGPDRSRKFKFRSPRKIINKYADEICLLCISFSLSEIKCFTKTFFSLMAVVVFL